MARLLVFLGRLARLERAEVSPLACLRVLLSRVQPIVPGLELADHDRLGRWNRADLLQHAQEVRLTPSLDAAAFAELQDGDAAEFDPLARVVRGDRDVGKGRPERVIECSDARDLGLHTWITEVCQRGLQDVPIVRSRHPPSLHSRLKPASAGFRCELRPRDEPSPTSGETGSTTAGADRTGTR